MLSTVFNNQQRSGYEELFSYGPYFYKDLLEMDVNYRFAGSTLDVMAEKLELLMNDQIIDFMDEPTITRMEHWLAITTDETKSLEDRRKKVKLLWNGGEKLCGRVIKSVVMSYTGCSEPPVVKMTNHLSIMAQIKDENTVYLSDLNSYIERMKPAQIRSEILLVSTTKIKIQTIVKHYVYSFDLCGEKPDIATFGAYLQTQIDLQTAGTDFVYPHEQSNEFEEAGTYPQITTKGAVIQEGIDIGTKVSDSVYGHNQSSEEQETGTYPNIATVGQQNNSGIAIGTTESSAVLSFVECGTNLCGEEGL
jgi:hypothetical protein